METLGHATAIFRQVNKDDQWKHHDALEFPDGRIVLLTRLSEGQEATVLQLPARPTTAAEANAQTRIASAAGDTSVTTVPAAVDFSGVLNGSCQR